MRCDHFRSAPLGLELDFSTCSPPGPDSQAKRARSLPPMALVSFGFCLAAACRCLCPCPASLLLVPLPLSPLSPLSPLPLPRPTAFEGLAEALE